MASPSAISLSEPLAAAFRAARDGGRAALVPYLTAGFPDRDTSLAALQAADRWGDVLEVGVPFSDPLADGPTIQRASHVALHRGMSLAGTLDLIGEAGLVHPVVLFTYLNPVLAYGVPRLLADAAAAGVSGLLLTDLPAGGDPAVEQAVADGGLDLIRLVAPTTTDRRLAEIAAGASGFLYLVTRLGVTGVRPELARDLAQQVHRVKACSSLPVAAGFGISTPEQARAAGELADGVVVGSALVARLEREGVTGMAGLLGSLRAALEGPRP